MKKSKKAGVNNKGTKGAKQGAGTKGTAREDSRPTGPDSSRKRLVDILGYHGVSVRGFDGLRGDAYEKHLAKRSLAELDGFYGRLLNTAEHYEKIQELCPEWGEGSKNQGKRPSARTLSVIRDRIQLEWQLADKADLLKLVRQVAKELTGLEVSERAVVLQGLQALVASDLMGLVKEGQKAIDHLPAVDRVVRVVSAQARVEQGEKRAELAGKTLELRGKELEVKRDKVQLEREKFSYYKAESEKAEKAETSMMPSGVSPGTKGANSNFNREIRQIRETKSISGVPKGRTFPEYKGEGLTEAQKTDRMHYKMFGAVADNGRRSRVEIMRKLVEDGIAPASELIKAEEEDRRRQKVTSVTPASVTLDPNIPKTETGVPPGANGVNNKGAEDTKAGTDKNTEGAGESKSTPAPSGALGGLSSRPNALPEEEEVLPMMEYVRSDHRPVTGYPEGLGSCTITQQTVDMATKRYLSPWWKYYKKDLKRLNEVKKMKEACV